MEKMKKFSELVRERYAFLVGQLEKMLQDYFGLSTQVKEMQYRNILVENEVGKRTAPPVHAREL